MKQRSNSSSSSAHILFLSITHQCKCVFVVALIWFNYCMYVCMVYAQGIPLDISAMAVKLVNRQNGYYHCPQLERKITDGWQAIRAAIGFCPRKSSKVNNTGDSVNCFLMCLLRALLVSLLTRLYVCVCVCLWLWLWLLMSFWLCRFVVFYSCARTPVERNHIALVASVVHTFCIVWECRASNRDRSEAYPPYCLSTPSPNAHVLDASF